MSIVNKIEKLGEFKLAGQTFEIWETDEEGLHGMCDVDDNIIYLNHSGRRQDTVENTLLHEAIHAVIYHHGGSIDYLDEGLVRSLTAAIHQLIQSEEFMRFFQYKRDKRFKRI